MDARSGDKNYKIEYKLAQRFDRTREHRCTCKLVGDSNVEEFYFGVVETFDFFSTGVDARLKFFAFISTVQVSAEGSDNILHESTRAIQRRVLSFFDNLGLNISKWFESGVSLDGASRESIIACAKALFGNISIDKEGQEEIIDFLEKVKRPDTYLMRSEIVGLVSAGKVEMARAAALRAEKYGYHVIYQLGQALIDKNYAQAAYDVMSQIPTNHQDYRWAQIDATKLAASPDVYFDTGDGKIKALYKHGENSGQGGQSAVDEYFRGLTKLEDELAKAKESKQEAKVSTSPLWSRKPVEEIATVGNAHQSDVSPRK